MIEVDALLSLHKCDCGRSFCDYFSGSFDDGGRSFSEAEVRDILEVLPKAQEHLMKLLKPAPAAEGE